MKLTIHFDARVMPEPRRLKFTATHVQTRNNILRVKAGALTLNIPLIKIAFWTIDRSPT